MYYGKSKKWSAKRSYEVLDYCYLHLLVVQWIANAAGVGEDADSSFAR